MIAPDLDHKVENLRLALKAMVAKHLHDKKVPHESALDSALAQDALLHLCKDGLKILENGSDEDKARWVQTAAHDAVVQFVRYSTAAKRDAHRTTSLEALPAGCRHPIRDPEWDEIRQRLADALAALTPEQREVIELHYLQGESYGMIARRRGCTRESVIVMAIRARERIRKRFGRSLEELL